jgi:hypothetical protein
VGGAHTFYFLLIKTNNRHNEPDVFASPSMFSKHSEHTSAPSESNSGCSWDAAVVRDAHPHGQAHTRPPKRPFLSAGRAARALPHTSTPHV